MTISELIERLEAFKAEHGDLPVFHHHSAVDCDPVLRIEPADTNGEVEGWVHGAVLIWGFGAYDGL